VDDGNPSLHNVGFNIMQAWMWGLSGRAISTKLLDLIGLFRFGGTRSIFLDYFTHVTQRVHKRTKESSFRRTHIPMIVKYIPIFYGLHDGFLCPL